jgi:uncharacterized membrane protein YGL010W
MKSIHGWLKEYGDSHQHPVNIFAHWVCVPLIVFSLLGLLWSLPFPLLDLSPPFVLNWATLLLLLALFYYFLLSWQLAVGMIVVVLAMYLVLLWLEGLTVPLWLISAVIFVVAWFGQFIGHSIEGKRPSFFTDIQFLLIGPLWLLAAIYRKLNLSY